MLKQLGDELQQFLEDRCFGSRKPSRAVRVKLRRAYSDQFTGFLKLGQLKMPGKNKTLTVEVGSRE